MSCDPRCQRCNGIFYKSEIIQGLCNPCYKARDAESLREDAERWRALMASDRIRFVGGSRAEDGTWGLVGFDFHAKHPAPTHPDSLEILLAYVDNIRNQKKG